MSIGVYQDALFAVPENPIMRAAMGLAGLGVYQQADFAVPENPVMRAAVGLPVMPPASSPGDGGHKLQGVKGGAIQVGMGCAGRCPPNYKPIAQPFGLSAMYQPLDQHYPNSGMQLSGTIGPRPGMVLDGPMMIKGFGNYGDYGIRGYADWYAPRVPGALIMNGDRNGLGAYFKAPMQGMSGLGDVQAMMTNFGNGNFTAALTGNDIVSSVPNWLILGAGIWLLSGMKFKSH